LAPTPNAKVREYLNGQPFAATEGRRRDTAAPVSEKSSSLLGARIVLYLAVLGCLLWGALHLTKRLLPGGRQLFASPGVEVLGRTHLDPRRYIALVRVGRRMLVVGVGPDEMAPLAEVTGEEEVAELLAVARPKTESGLSLFQRLFHRQVAQNDAQAESVRKQAAVTDLESSLQTLRARVKAIRDIE